MQPKSRVKQSGWAIPSSWIAFFGVTFLLYMALLLYGQSVLRGVLEEKTTRVAEVVISSVRPEVLLAGKIIGIGGVAVTQMGIWMLSSFWIGSNVVPMMIRRNAPAMGAASAG